MVMIAPAAPRPSEVAVVAARSPRGKPVDEPVTSQKAQAPEWYAECEGREAAHRHQGGQGRAAEAATWDVAGTAPTQARIVLMAAQPELEGQQHEAAEQQHGRQHVRGRPVERRAVLVVDRSGEGRVTQHLQGTELGEKMQRHDERPSQQSGAELRQDDADEGVPRAVAERRSRLLQSGVQTAQHRRDRQIDQGVVGQGHDHEGSGIPLDPGREGDPAEAVDEGRHGQWGHEQHVPDPPSG